jgi:hypothetical protein
MPFIFRTEFSLVIKCDKKDKVIKDEHRLPVVYTELDPELNRKFEENLAKDPNFIDKRDYLYNRQSKLLEFQKEQKKKKK